MSSPIFTRPTPILTMADGTVKQVNPFSGTQVWTVPGRGNRPLSKPAVNVVKLNDADHAAACAFCSDRNLETPPEKARVIARSVAEAAGIEADSLTDDYVLARRQTIEQQVTGYEFRRVSNLFEIVTFEYWEANYGYQPDAITSEWMDAYLASPQGRAHVINTVRTKRTAAGLDPNGAEEVLLAGATAFFAGGHDLIIGARHYTPGATTSDQLASSGTLSVAEHEALMAFTIDSMHDLYQRNRYAPYVAVFQNWLKPAGASFDHLHKQLVAIDERGVQAEMEIARLRSNPNMYNEWAVDYAASHNLIIAENDHAVLFAGFGHRYPTLEIFSKSPTAEPWKQTPEEIRGMSDLVHAAHAATGPDVPCNEEWHHKPADLDMPMPWRIMLKWRVSNLAGFEGGTKIYLNTLSPWNIRDRIVSTMYKLRDAGLIADTLRIATECEVKRNSLKYNPFL
ncbi:DUF4921 family protein [Corynebacterium sp. SCR221107]|uniref:DUF4921 family protein n=1 Tax=Corynebacterium sp. SCR221107 TaxID=3017361 RepID=UPI0022EC5E69|nr:DUF4921 family protein [Corynebacterium sp. SCR221107]WBT07958.1 DUF4921 family protein [Corynebacterium sp. SCR221107]